jgi:hypothetical protein
MHIFQAAFSPKPTWRHLLVGVSLFFIIIFIVQAAAHPDSFLLDFQKDYFWTKAFLHGLNPYDVKAVSALLQRPVYPFLYMPLSLGFFAPFTLLPYEYARIAALIFYGIALLFGLIVFSRSLLTIKDYGALYGIFAVLAFNGALYISIKTGNVSSLESALIFAALVCWLKGRHRWFLCSILAASLFKLTPLFFLVLVFFDKKPRWKSTAVSCLIFITLTMVSFAAMPVSLKEWLPYFHSNVGGWMDLDIACINPSMLCLLKTVFHELHVSTHHNPFIVGIYALWLGVVFLFTLRAGVFLFRKGGDAARTDVVTLALLCYALILPRFYDYGWVIVIPAVFRALMTKEYGKTIGPLMALCLLPIRQDIFPEMSIVLKIATAYSPIIVATGAWLLLIQGIVKRPSPQQSEPASLDG